MAKQKRELTLIPMVKVHPNKIITYNEIHWYPNRPPRRQNDSANQKIFPVRTEQGIELKQVSNKFLSSSRQGNGILSKQAKKRLKLAIEYFLLLNKPDRKSVV